jgi:hypothetical protein
MSQERKRGRERKREKERERDGKINCMKVAALIEITEDGRKLNWPRLKTLLIFHGLEI